jgi:hypothetical protein
LLQKGGGVGLALLEEDAGGKEEKKFYSIKGEE